MLICTNAFVAVSGVVNTETNFHDQFDENGGLIYSAELPGYPGMLTSTSHLSAICTDAISELTIYDGGNYIWDNNSNAWNYIDPHGLNIVDLSANLP